MAVLLLLLLPVKMGSCGRKGELIRSVREKNELELIVGEMWCHCVQCSMLMKPYLLPRVKNTSVGVEE